jgi:hypothetical protein
MSDKDLIKQLLDLEKIQDEGEAGTIEQETALEENEAPDKDNIFDTISDIFTGTKRTEYASMPEIGAADAGSLGKNIKAAGGLLLTPNQRSQAQIIQAAVPGSAIREDKFGNVIVNMPDGKNYYLNKPGASLQDVLQTTSQILAYIPGYSAVAKRFANSYFKRVVGQVAASGATSVAQDLGAKGLGADQAVDVPKLAVSLVAPAVFEGAIFPVASATGKILKRLSKNKKYMTVGADGKPILSLEGKEALKEAGVDESQVSDEYVKKFFERFGRGVGDDINKVKQEAEFGIDLASSQTGLPKDRVNLANLYEATKGTFGPRAQKQAVEFFEKQNIQIRDSVESLLERFNKGQVGVNDLEGAGARILDSVRNNFKKAEDKIDTLYNTIDKRAIFTGGGSNIKLLSESARKSVLDSVGSLDPNIMKGTVAALNSIDDLVNQVIKKTPKRLTDAKIATIQAGKTKAAREVPVFDSFEKRRQYINDLINAARKEGGPDFRALINIKKSFDKFYNDAIDNALFAGGNVKNIAKARNAIVERERLFGINPITRGGKTISDKAGEVLHKIINDPDITPYEVINYAIGAKKIGVGQTPLRVIKRLKKIIGVKDIAKSLDNRDFVSLRTGVFDRILTNSIRNNKFNPEILVREFDDVFRNNKSFMGELFTGKEQRQLRTLVTTIRKTLQPRDLANLSNTGSVLSRALQQAGRGVVGAGALKIGGINYLLAVRNAFDRGVELFKQQKGAKVIQKELGDVTSDLLQAVREGFKSQRPGVKVGSGRVDTTPAITGTTQQSIGQQRDVRAPRIEPFELRGNFQGAVQPTQPVEPTQPVSSSMFASLFPQDALGAAIADRNRG